MSSQAKTKSAQAKKFLFKKEGHQYQLCVAVDEDDCLLVKLNHRDLEIGFANCVRLSADEMLLADITIYPHIPLNLLSNVSRLLLNSPKKYRKRGLGTSLLKFIIQYVRKKGIKRITGKIINSDVENDPNLLMWFQMQGFKIGEVLPEDKSNTVARIYMDLN